MAYRFIPVPIFIITALFCAVMLLIYSVKYYRMKSKVLSSGLMLIGVSCFIIAVARVIKEYFNYEQYDNLLLIIASISMFIGYILFMIFAWADTRRDPERPTIKSQWVNEKKFEYLMIFYASQKDLLKQVI